MQNTKLNIKKTGLPHFSMDAGFFDVLKTLKSQQ